MKRMSKKKPLKSGTASPLEGANYRTGPLQSLVVEDHCQMCGRTNKDRAYAPLEPAFNPSGCAMTLCKACRIGSAELLQSERSAGLSRCAPC